MPDEDQGLRIDAAPAEARPSLLRLGGPE